MSKLRKLMAVIVSVAMLVSLFVAPAFAEQTMTDIEVCETLDVLRGTGDGLTAEYLASKPTRYQAARLFLRLLGLEEEAIAFEGEANFSDVEALADWQLAPENKALIAYLYANSELGFIGYTDGTFRPFREITAMEYYKILLTALGYEQGVDFEYGEDMLDFAADLGLSEVADVEDFAISHLATATVEALKAAVKDSEQTLLEKLVADGVIDEDDAIATGLFGEEVVDLEVANLTADNLAEIFVKFNQAMDKDTIKVDNFKVAGEKVAAAELLDDGVTVKLTVALAKIGNNGVEYKIVIADDVKSATGAAFAADYEATLRVFDRELPYVTGIELLGPKTIEITFSEPIEKEPTVKINKGVYGCSVGAITTVTNKVTVTIAASRLPDGDYTLAITDAEDYAGFKMDADEWTLAYAADETPISAEVTSASQTEVKIKFNKAVKLNDSDVKTYFYHTYSVYKPTSVSPGSGTLSAEFVLDFTGNPIPEGQTQLVIKAKGGDGNAIEDGWGNKLESNIIITINVTADTTAPTVLAGDAGLKVKSQTQMELYFSEALDSSTVKKDNFAVEDAEGNDVTISSVSYSADASKSEYKVVINFSSALSGDYTITISGITDNSVDKNEIVKTTLSFTVDDMTPPSLGAVTAKCIEGATDEADIIYVYYPEKMTTEGKYSVIDASNYLFDNAALPDDTELELFGTTGTVVKITLPVDNTRTVLGKKLVIARVADIAGNASVDLSKEITITAEAAPAVEAIEQTAANKLTFVFDSILESVLADAFVIEVTGATGSPFIAAGIEEWTIDSGKTYVDVLLTEATVDAIEGKDATYGTDSSNLIDQVTGVTLKIAGEFVVAQTGMKASGTKTVPVSLPAGVSVDDKWAPTYSSIAVGSSSVAGAVYYAELAFSEALDTTDDDLYAHDLVVTDLDGKTLVAGKDYTTEVVTVAGASNGNLRVHFVKGQDILAGAAQSKYFTIASKDSITYIVDGSSNKIATFDAKDAKN